MRFVLYSNQKSIISKLIRWQTRGQYSHAALLTSDGSIIESMEGIGVRSRSSITEGAEGDSYDVFTVQTTENQDKIIEMFAGHQIGKKYDYLGILRFLTREPNYNQKNRYFCSELVFDAFGYAGIDLFKDMQGWEVSPALLSHTPLATKLTIKA